MNELEILGRLSERKELIPLMLDCVRAGHSVEADSFFEVVDIKEYLSLDNAYTFFVRSGITILNAGIYAGDILIVDRAKEVKENNIVIAYHKIDELSLRKVVHKKGYVFLISANPEQPPMILEDPIKQIWGVVTHNIHKHINFNK